MFIIMVRVKGEVLLRGIPKGHLPHFRVYDEEGANEVAKKLAAENPKYEYFVFSAKKRFATAEIPVIEQTICS